MKDNSSSLSLAVEGMEFYAYHGYYEEERIIGGEYVVDVYLKLAAKDAALQKDELSGTFNYERVLEICSRQMRQPSKLIEDVAARILDEVAKSGNGLSFAKVRVSKLNPPLAAKVKRTFVELEKVF